MSCAFHRQMLRECLEARDNFLCVMGRGLGLDTLLSLFVRLYSSYSAAEVAGGVAGGLVFFLNIDKDDAALFVERAVRQGVEKLPQVVAGESQQERAKMYARGGVVFINSQILVVDLLRSVVPYGLCNGVIVYNGHFVEEHGTLWFALRLLRLHCGPRLFVKGFTCRVDQLQAGTRCEKAMRGLLASKLFLWPRFEARVLEELNAHQPEVVELFVPLSEKMAAMYGALQRLTVAIVQEVSKGQAALDISKPTLENAFVENWPALINGQLMGDRQAGTKTHRLVSDLSSMRKLCTVLLHYDCVLYNRFLETIRLEKMGKNASDWFFHEAADVLFQNAKSRVVTMGVGEDGAATTNVLLEPLPKWGALREILAEIRNDATRGTVLVVTQDERSARQVTGVLSKGDTGWLLEQWTTSLDRGMYRSRNTGAGEPRRAYSSAAAAKGGTGASRKKKPKRSASASAVPNKSIAEMFQGKKQVGTIAPLPAAPSVQSALRRDQFDRQFGVLEQGIVIHALDSGADPATLLQRLKPMYVILYDTNLSFLRSIECYKSTPQGDSHAMRVYLLAYDVVSEDTRELESENEAFEKVIHIKANMLIEEERGQVTRGTPYGDEEEAQSTRIGGVREPEKRPYVVVDTREFMGSKIPAKLWSRGFDIVPLMLEIGDYIVANDIVIERKTVSDLIGSFADGRLFKQCTNMQTHYAIPVLLIEFQGGPFLLQNKSDLLPQVVQNSLSSKLALLVLHFPKLRIFWSRDTAQSEAFIMGLRKSTRVVGGPDLARITQSAVTSVRAGDDGIVDITPRLLLAKLPGILAGTADSVAQKAKTLRRLIVSWNEAEYAPLMGKENAALLTLFLTHTYATDDG